VPHVKHELLSK